MSTRKFYVATVRGRHHRFQSNTLEGARIYARERWGVHGVSVRPWVRGRLDLIGSILAILGQIAGVALLGFIVGSLLAFIVWLTVNFPLR